MFGAQHWHPLSSRNCFGYWGLEDKDRVFRDLLVEPRHLETENLERLSSRLPKMQKPPKVWHCLMT